MGKASCEIGKSASVLIAILALFSVDASAAVRYPQAKPCPTSSLAPDGIVPNAGTSGTLCANGCLVSFKGFLWWTAYQYTAANGYYDGDLSSAFSPTHVTVDSQGLHLIADHDIGLGGPDVPWSGAEAVLMFKPNPSNPNRPSEANLGYGDYLVTAKLITAPRAWSGFDPNMVFGMFTYERYGTSPDGRGTASNPHRELDASEISRWSWNHATPKTCPLPGPVGMEECKLNAQFTLQDASQDPTDDIHRYNVGANQEITIVMKWHGAEKPVTFAKYRGAYTLDNLPTPDATWTTPAKLNKFIPAAACERFHLNTWFANGTGMPATKQPQEIVVTNFEFQSATK